MPSTSSCIAPIIPNFIAFSLRLLKQIYKNVRKNNYLHMKNNKISCNEGEYKGSHFLYSFGLIPVSRRKKREKSVASLKPS